MQSQSDYRTHCHRNALFPHLYPHNGYRQNCHMFVIKSFWMTLSAICTWILLLRPNKIIFMISQENGNWNLDRGESQCRDYSLPNDLWMTGFSFDDLIIHIKCLNVTKQDHGRHLWWQTTHSTMDIARLMNKLLSCNLFWEDKQDLFCMSRW